MKHLTSIILLFCFAYTCSYAQDEILNKSDKAEAEFHTAINPLDTNNIVLVTMHHFLDLEESYLTIYYTRDFGITWAKSEYNGIVAGEIGAGDPVIAFNNEGHLILTSLVGDEDDNILTVLSESQDGGETWERKYEYHDEFTDKPWMAIDIFEASPHTGNIYIPVATNDLSFFTLDKNFNLISDIEEVPNAEHIPSVVVDNEGEIYLSSLIWEDPNIITFQHYTDGGATHVFDNEITQFPDYTFDAEDVSFRFNPCPYLAIDNSDGPFAGRIYLSYTGSEEVDETFFNIFLTHSDDQGRTWSEPKIVHSNDTPGVQQFYSSIYVTANGTVLIDWYDRTNDGSNLLFTDVMLGFSNDGGESFTEIQLTSEPMSFAGLFGAGTLFGIGDYHQLVGTDNTALSFWSDGRTNDGDMNIYFAKVDLARPFSSIREQGLISEKIKVENVYPIPTNDKLTIDIELEKSYKLQCQVLDIAGRIVIDQPAEIYLPGKQQIALSFDLPRGEYVLALTSEGGYYNHIKFLVD